MSDAELIASAVVVDGGLHLSKLEIVYQLLTHFAESGHIPSENVPALLEAVMKREELATSGLGAGIAIPNAVHPAIPRHQALLALCRKPVNFDCLDGEAADIFVLCLAPPLKPGESSRAMQERSHRLLRRLCDKDFCRQIRNSKTAEELRACINKLPCY